MSTSLVLIIMCVCCIMSLFGYETYSQYNNPNNDAIVCPSSAIAPATYASICTVCMCIFAMWLIYAYMKACGDE